MSNPFSSRLMKRFFIVFGSFFGSYIVPAILPFSIFYLTPLVVLIGLPIYFTMQDNKGKNSCIELIRNKYNQESVLTVETYHPNLEWGFLTLTQQALFFIPKKGEIMNIPLSSIANYGFRSIGTGDFTTTISRVGNTGLNIGSTRENKAPVFYFYLTEIEDLFYFHTRKHEKMFKTMQKIVGTDTSKLKSNY
ncbi:MULTISPECIES: hypothetical protein [Bacillus cereus group]|jgi:hypothetical protein|uniref:hypothetical protein n=1 Tax=Bacillus cereus group TaxID=86661 RepID=UPI001F3E6CD4|nr:hypothetical protein [Bacillus cereus]MDA1521397.1 hypothetical protein [Bacillus cereus]BCC09393.1 hypothetical protein BCM0060_p2059 [Bacillus cereus]BCC16613.1 hypothetical protein BCM0075_1383 [Bacillus cereus]BCC50506.1 hypothetical protein BCJMU02_p2100 [Bacillus cereus]BCD08810.1 hypothetical protein BC30052_p2092 [Bacillus cereus]